MSVTDVSKDRSVLCSTRNGDGEQADVTDRKRCRSVQFQSRNGEGGEANVTDVSKPDISLCSTRNGVTEETAVTDSESPDGRQFQSRDEGLPYPEGSYRKLENAIEAWEGYQGVNDLAESVLPECPERHSHRDRVWRLFLEAELYGQNSGRGGCCTNPDRCVDRNHYQAFGRCTLPTHGEEWAEHGPALADIHAGLWRSARLAASEYFARYSLIPPGFTDQRYERWRICEHCGKGFSVRRREQSRRYCGGECVRLARIARAAEKRGTRTCTTCGEDFTPKRSDSTYCSGKCRQKAYRQRGSAVACDPNTGTIGEADT